MHRSKLKNKFNKNPTEENKSNYKKQRNFCVKLLRQEKKKFYNNLDLYVFEDNRKFWSRIKPLFSKKHKAGTTKIIIVENNIIFSDNEIVAEILNNFFVDSVENLGIESFLTETGRMLNSNAENDIEDIVLKNTSHPSILKIKEYVKPVYKFEFQDVTTVKIRKDIRNLNTRKAQIDSDIPAKLLVESGDIVSDYITKMYNHSKNTCKFENSLKFATVIPINKTTTKTTNKKDYRPVSLLPLVCKIYERIMHDEILHIYSDIGKFIVQNNVSPL